MYCKVALLWAKQAPKASPLTGHVSPRALLPVCVSFAYLLRQTVRLRGQEAAQKLQKEPEPPKEAMTGLGCKDRRAAVCCEPRGVYICDIYDVCVYMMYVYITTRGSVGLSPRILMIVSCFALLLLVFCPAAFVCIFF